MAISRVKTWSSGEVLTASDLNAEFNNVLNNGSDLVSPFTKAISLGGFALNFDAANTIAATGTTSGISITGGTIREPVEDSVTAFATGGQTNATALSVVKKYHRISVCATVGDSVKLPTSTTGQAHYIRNDGAASAQVYGTSPDTINGIATATGLTLPTGSGAWYVCTTAGNWTASLFGVGNMTGGINEKLTTVVSATTPDIFALTVGNVVDYTGTATATGFATAPQAGARRRLVCAGAAVFTAGANMLIAGVPSGSNYTAAAEDVIEVVAFTTTQFILYPLKYDGTAIRSAIPWAVAGGTADALTATYSPPNAALTDGLLLSVRAVNPNATTTPTFAPDSLTAHTIVKAGGAAVVPGDIAANLSEYILRYNLANTRWELLNPSNGSGLRGSFTASLTGCTAGVTGTANYSVFNNVVTVNYPPMTGTSNTTACTVTGQPNAIKPTTAHNGNPIIIQDNSAPAAFGRADVNTDGTLTLFINASSATFTNANVKGLIAGCTITYNLN